MENVINLRNRFNTPKARTGSEAPVLIDTVAAAPTVNAPKQAVVPGAIFLEALLKMIRERQDEKLRSMIRKIGFAAYPSLGRMLEDKTFSACRSSFEKEVAMAIFAIKNPELAKRSTLGQDALELALNVDFAARAYYSGRG